MTSTASDGAGRAGVTARLSVMMFLQFFLWGAWYVTLGPFMKAMGMSDGAVGNAYTVGPIAAIIAPVFLGMVADRFFASQKVLGVLHLAGGALLLAPGVAAGLPMTTGAGGAPVRESLPFVGLLLAHMLCYMPTLGLSNTVAFHNITDQEKQFPLIRVLGTIGWIAAGFVVGYLAQSRVAETATLKGAALETARAASPLFFYVAGGSGVLLGLLSFALPHTPPPLKGKPMSVGSALGLDALSLLKDGGFAVFLASSFLICIPLAAYYSFAGVYAGLTGIENVPVKMTFGQMSEIVFMLVMPLFFARLGVKWMLIVGMLAWAVRYGLFAGAWQGGGGGGGEHVQWMVLAGIILHGICYDFFFVTGQIYVDKAAPREIRGQAQGLLVLVTQGLGMLIGNQLFPLIIAHFTSTNAAGAEVKNWQMIWLTPAVFAAGVMVVFALLFKERGRGAKG